MSTRTILACLLAAFLLLTGPAATACDLRCTLPTPSCHAASASAEAPMAAMPGMTMPHAATHSTQATSVCTHHLCAPQATLEADTRSLAAVPDLAASLPLLQVLAPTLVAPCPRAETPPPLLLSPLARHTALRL